MRKNLSSGFTTGACAAAAARAAAELSFTGLIPKAVLIPFPDGRLVSFSVHRGGKKGKKASASIIKDAGADADITHRAEIEATLEEIPGADDTSCLIEAGPGVGRVTKPGLALSPGEAAINPVPRRMIREALALARREFPGPGARPLRVTIAVPDGERLALKTLNRRLGIVGGISILGTTGYVIPSSLAAWRDTIVSSLNVARAAGLTEIVLATGRTSERAHEEAFCLPEEAYILAGDQVAFALRQAAGFGFRRIHLAAQWGKLLKIASGRGQTHVKFGVLDVGGLGDLWKKLGLKIPGEFSSARELFYELAGRPPGEAAVIFAAVLAEARLQAERWAGNTAVTVHLVSYEGRMAAGSGE